MRLYPSLLAATLLASVASVAQAEETENPHQGFAGTIIRGDSTTTTIDTLATYNHQPSGTEAFAEFVATSGEESPYQLSIGARSPWAGDLLRLSFLGEVGDHENWGYTGFMECDLGVLTLNTGVMQTDETIPGSFLGGSLEAGPFSAEGEFWFYRQPMEGQGFVSYQGTENLFLAVGGRTADDQINATVAWVNPQDVGVLSRTVLDLDDDVQRGSLIVASNSTYTENTARFRTHIDTGTEMRRVATGHLLDSWAPSDAFASNGGFTGAVHWSHAPDLTTVSPTAYFTPGDRFIGLGATLEIEPDGNVSPFVRLDLYTQIPGIPLEAEVIGTLGEEGVTSGGLYFGYMP